MNTSRWMSAEFRPDRHDVVPIEDRGELRPAGVVFGELAVVAADEVGRHLVLLGFLDLRDHDLPAPGLELGGVLQLRAALQDALAGELHGIVELDPLASREKEGSAVEGFQMLDQERFDFSSRAARHQIIPTASTLSQSYRHRPIVADG